VQGFTDVPIGMEWRETIDASGGTNIYCSGDAPPTPVANTGKAVVVLGVVLGMLFMRVGVPWFMPASVIAAGVAMMLARRAGGPATLMITIGPTEVRFSRGWLGPLVFPRENVRDVVVARSRQQFIMSTSSFGQMHNDAGDDFFRVLVLDRNAGRVVACFANDRQAQFFAARVRTVFEGYGANAPRAPFR